MARSPAGIAVVAAALAAVVVPGVLLARAARADVAVGAVSHAGEAMQVVVARPEVSASTELAVGPFDRGEGEARFSLRVAVPAARQVDSVLELRDARGATLGRCAQRRRVNRYTRLALLTCPVARPEELRAVLVEATVPEGSALVQVRRRPDGLYEGGSLLRVQPKGVAAALERLSVARPRAFGAWTMLVSLGLSTALLVGALAAALGRPA